MRQGWSLSSAGRASLRVSFAQMWLDKNKQALNGEKWAADNRPAEEIKFKSTLCALLLCEKWADA